MENYTAFKLWMYMLIGKTAHLSPSLYIPKDDVLISKDGQDNIEWVLSGDEIRKRINKEPSVILTKDIVIPVCITDIDVSNNKVYVQLKEKDGAGA